MAATQKKKQQEVTAPQVEARIDRMVDGDYKTKAYASVTIAGAFAVHGLRVIETDKGRFISMPQESYKKNGETVYAAVDDLRTRTVSNIVCIVIALAGLITISPASLLGALLAMLPFYLCAGFGLMGGGDWRLAAAVGFVLGVGRVLTGFLFMSVALLLASLVMRAFPALRQSAAKKQPLVPYFAVAFIPAYFL